MMRNRSALLSFGMVALLVACDSGGLTTREMQAAAVDRARQQFNLSADAAMEAQVWAGKTWDDQVVLCGTVTGRNGGAQVPAQRFAATEGDPVRWLIFENAHAPLADTGGDRVPDWVDLCGTGPQG